MAAADFAEVLHAVRDGPHGVEPYLAHDGPQDEREFVDAFRGIRLYLCDGEGAVFYGEAHRHSDVGLDAGAHILLFLLSAHGDEVVGVSFGVGDFLGAVGPVAWLGEHLVDIRHLEVVLYYPLVEVFGVGVAEAYGEAVDVGGVEHQQAVVADGLVVAAYVAPVAALFELLGLVVFVVAHAQGVEDHLVEEEYVVVEKTAVAEEEGADGGVAVEVARYARHGGLHQVGYLLVFLHRYFPQLDDIGRQPAVRLAQQGGHTHGVAAVAHHGEDDVAPGLLCVQLQHIAPFAVGRGVCAAVFGVDGHARHGFVAFAVGDAPFQDGLLLGVGAEADGRGQYGESQSFHLSVASNVAAIRSRASRSWARGQPMLSRKQPSYSLPPNVVPSFMTTRASLMKRSASTLWGMP